MSVASWYLMLVKAWRFCRTTARYRRNRAILAGGELEDGLEILSGRNGDLAAHLLGQAMTAAEHLRARSGSSLATSCTPTSSSPARCASRSAAAPRGSSRVSPYSRDAVDPRAPFRRPVRHGVGHLPCPGRISSSGIGESRCSRRPGRRSAGNDCNRALRRDSRFVLAYNTLTRANRLTLAALDAFAHDVHAYLSTGAHGCSRVPRSGVGEGPARRCQWRAA